MINLFITIAPGNSCMRKVPLGHVLFWHGDNRNSPTLTQTVFLDNSQRLRNMAIFSGSTKTRWRYQITKSRMISESCYSSSGYRHKSLMARGAIGNRSSEIGIVMANAFSLVYDLVLLRLTLWNLVTPHGVVVLGWTFVQEMVWCLTGPSHYPNQWRYRLIF